MRDVVTLLFLSKKTFFFYNQSPKTTQKHRISVCLCFVRSQARGPCVLPSPRRAPRAPEKHHYKPTPREKKQNVVMVPLVEGRSVKTARFVAPFSFSEREHASRTLPPSFKLFCLLLRSFFYCPGGRELVPRIPRQALSFFFFSLTFIFCFCFNG